MKRAVVFLLLGVFLSGCATYKFHQGRATSDKGYVVSYKGVFIPEYTQGPDKSLPGIALAKERFKRRRATVEYYYKEMGQMHNRFQQYIWQPVTLFADFIGGIFRWPFMAVADYKYNHNPKYKEKGDRLDEQQDALEKAKLDSLKAKLSEYIKADLAKEQPATQVSAAATKEDKLPVPALIEPAQPAATVTVTASAAAVLSEKAKQPPVPAEQVKQPVATVEPVKSSTEAPQVTSLAPENKDTAVKQSQTVVSVPQVKEEIPVAPVLVKFAVPNAVIVARPQKGLSPLTVKFSAGRSSSLNGRIVSYAWDFGDGDSATLKNPSNTYWSTSYGTKSFTATLTVKDEKGQSASASVIIDVLTK